MKSRHIAAGALFGLLLVGCSGGEEVAESAPTTTVAETAVVIEETTTTTIAGSAPATTSAPTTAAPADPPSSLAFASSKDIGRLYEIAGTATGYDDPRGEPTSTLTDGTLVQAATARSAGETLRVAVVDPSAPDVLVAWVDAESLRNTSLTYSTTEERRRGQLRQVRRVAGVDELAIVTTPGGSTSVRTVVPNEVASYGGTTTLTSDGERWLDVIDPVSDQLIGWLPAAGFIELRSNYAHDLDHEDVPRRADPGITYGAPLTTGSLVTDACNGLQLRFDNPSSLGMAMVMGQDVPYAVETNGREIWTARSGSTLYVPPQSSTILTLLAVEGATWHFVGLDADFTADSVRNASGTLEATSSQQYSKAAGNCVTDALFFEEDNTPDLYLNPDGSDPTNGATIEDSTAPSTEADATDAGAADGTDASSGEDGAAEGEATTSTTTPPTTTTALVGTGGAQGNGAVGNEAEGGVPGIG